MADSDAINGTLQNIVKQIGQEISAIGTMNATVSRSILGMSFGGTSQPAMTIATTVSTASGLVIAANSTRLNIVFHSPSTTAPAIWVTPSTITAVAGNGIMIVAGDFLGFPSNCGWNAIAASGTGNVVLTIMEFS